MDDSVSVQANISWGELLGLLHKAADVVHPRNMTDEDANELEEIANKVRLKLEKWAKKPE